MGFLENLTNDAFANKMADHYQTHIGAAPFKSIRAEAENRNIRTPLWMAQPFMQRGIQKGQSNPSNKINFLTAPVIDTGRIAKFMGSPKGLLFIAKQAGLQLSNPKGEFLAPGPINAGRIYNPLATVAQIPAGALGIHIDRHGLGPLNLEAINYEKRIKAKAFLGQNRLVSIASQLNVGHFKKLVIAPSENEEVRSDKTFIQKVADKIKNTNWYINRSKKINAMSGLGGPNSVFGIGFTTHRTSKPPRIDGEVIVMYQPPTGTNLPIGETGDNSYEGKYKKRGNYVGAIASEKNNKPYFFDPTTDKDYPNKYKPSERPLPVGDPGPDSYKDLKGTEGDFKKIAEKNDFSPINIPAKSGDDAIIKYGALEYGAITRKGKINDSSNTIRSFRKGTEYDTQDNSYARLGLIDYGKSKGGQHDKYGELFNSPSDYVTLKLTRGDDVIRFRSYGLGSITDNTSFSWSEVKYAGRTMAQQKFDSVSRDVSHDLMVVSFTAVEAKQNYIRLNKLYQMASPSLSGGLATAAFCKLTLGDLYKDQNVIIDKITFTVDEDVPWDINIGTPDTETAEAELPMVIKLNLGYKLLTNADGGFFSKGTRYWKTDFGESTE